MPGLEELAADYQRRGDGTVRVYGKTHRVTHPIASFGLESFDVTADEVGAEEAAADSM